MSSPKRYEQDEIPNLRDVVSIAQVNALRCMFERPELADRASRHLFADDESRLSVFEAILKLRSDGVPPRSKAMGALLRGNDAALTLARRLAAWRPEQPDNLGAASLSLLEKASAALADACVVEVGWRCAA